MMDTPKSLLHIIQYCAPRSLYVGPAAFYARTGFDLHQLGSLPYTANPHLLITSSPKHNEPKFNRYLQTYLIDTSKFQLGHNEHGVYTPMLRSSASNPWLDAIRRDYSYQIELTLQKNLWWITALPGVRRVFLSGSASLGGATENSDIDLVLDTHWGLAWPVRLWLKLILKLQGRDVYRFKFQLTQLAYKLGLIRTRPNLNLVAKYKSRQGVKIDAGFIGTDFKTFAHKNIPKEPFMIFLHGSRPIHQSIPVPPHKAVVAFVLKVLFWLGTLVLFPLIALWANIYIWTHRSVPYMRICWSTICFYPIRHHVYTQVHE